MRSSRRIIIFVLAVAAFLSTTCIRFTGSEGKFDEVSPEDRAFLNSILSSLRSINGEFERTFGPIVYTNTGVTRVDIDCFSGGQSFFIRLGNIIDKYPFVANQVISTLVASLDDMTPTKTTYRGKAVPLGVMCYEALHTICYYEATDKNGNITAWDGTVLPGATEADLKIAKKAWKKILREKAYVML